MKIAKIPYSAAEVEVIFFSVEDILTTSNIDGKAPDVNDNWGEDGNLKDEW